MVRPDSDTEDRRVGGKIDSAVPLSNLTKVLEAMPGGAFLVDAHGRVSWVNHQALLLLGTTEDRLLGRTVASVAEFFFDEDTPCAVGEHPAAKALVEGRPQDPVTLGMRRQGGNLCWAVFRAVPFEDEGRTGAIVTFVDVTDLKRAAQRELEMTNQMRDAQKLESLGVLAGGIAHDFNNILAGILGNAAVARLDSAPGSSIHDVLRDIEDAARNAGTLCRQLLAYSGQGAFLVRPVDLNKLVHDATPLLSVSIDKKSRLICSCADELPLISVDAAQIRQVLVNLVNNASDALQGRKGTIHVRTGLVVHTQKVMTSGSSALPPGVYVVLDVKDDGCGMDEAIQARVFDPFFTTKLMGRGLGMAAVLGVARGHGGAVQIESAPGRGTSVRVSLPAHKQRSAVAKPVRPLPFEGTGTALIIDDEEGVRRVAQRMLQRFGFSVRTASDGVEGIEEFRQHDSEIAVILLDLTMPRLSGEETFRALRQIRPDVPIILSSGYSSESLQAGLLQGPTRFLQKPYDPHELGESLRGLLSPRRTV